MNFVRLIGVGYAAADTLDVPVYFSFMARGSREHAMTIEEVAAVGVERLNVFRDRLKVERLGADLNGAKTFHIQTDWSFSSIRRDHLEGAIDSVLIRLANVPKFEMVEPANKVSSSANIAVASLGDLRLSFTQGFDILSRRNFFTIQCWYHEISD